MSAKADDLNEFEAAEKGNLQSSLAEARAQASRRGEIAELKRLHTAENHRQDALRIIRENAQILEPPKYEKPVGVKSKNMPKHTWGLVISDWQLGQKDTLGGTGNVFEQSSEITKAQVKELWATVERLHDIQRNAVEVEELVIFSLGDLVEGDQMRVSQAGAIDALVSRQAVDVADLETYLIQQALARFPKVRVLHVGGNHDRISSKAGNAGLGELGYTDTFSWINGEFLRRLFEKSLDSERLEFVNHESFFGTAHVAGLRCVYEHGASFRSSTGSYGGVSYYSITNAASGYQKMLDGADIVLMGHHHTAVCLPMGGWGWQVLNGALTPSSGFAQTNFKGYRRPTQVLIELHEGKGLLNFRPIYLETPNMVRPGQFWKRKA